MKQMILSNTSKLQVHKFLVSVRSSMRPGLISDEAAEEIERDYEAVKERFMVSGCNECDAKRLNHSWNKLDLVAMAKRDEALYPLIVPAYFEPTQEAHSIVGAVFSRLSRTGDGLMFDYEAQEERADRAIISAYAILLITLDLQRECFKLKEMEPVLEVCAEDYKASHEIALRRTGRFQRSESQCPVIRLIGS